jgi:tRNA1Val (adenine37-N6)-methyltransferase
MAPLADEDLCFLSGDWRVFQKLRGHRWSLDDLMTAWVAASSIDRAAPSSRAPAALRALDLGCGLGSVLLMIAWKFPAADVTGIEAQGDRASMGRRSIAYNGVTDRCRIFDGDLRELAVLQCELGAAPFDLITGTPPYFPRGTGTESVTPQVAPCRFELRGGVEDYLAAAAPRLAPGGRLVMCTAALERDRVIAAVANRSLTPLEHWDIVPRQDKPTLVMIDVLARAVDASTPATRHTLVVRDRNGAWTPEFRAVRIAMGLPPTSPRGE